ncbi:MAG TPA: hypothetical protein PLI68_12695 [Bacteroidia bacterium]|nr:hypothetical protein [Bacteroidia bacterium]
MKRTNSILIFLFFGIFTCTAQDTLYKKNGDKVLAKILEVNTQTIKYTQVNSELPIYILDRSEVLSISYKNGSREVFNAEPNIANDDYVAQKIRSPRTRSKNLVDIQNSPITIAGNRYSISEFRLSPPYVDAIVLNKNDKQLSVMIKAAQDTRRTSKLLGFAPIPMGVSSYFLLIVGSINSANTVNGGISANYLATSGLLAVAAIGTGIASIVLNAQSKAMRRKAVEKYNLTYFGHP